MAIYALPAVLVVLYLVVDLLGASCSDDLLDNPDYACNAGGEAQWGILLLGLVSVAMAGAMLLTDLAAVMLRRIGRQRR